MGTDKALLPFGVESMLERTVRIVSKSVNVQNIVLVSAADQQLPQLPAGLQIVQDQHPFQGPLAALVAGLDLHEGRTAAVFATGCDTPLLEPALIDKLFDSLGDFVAVVPADEQRKYPLTAVYSTEILKVAKEQLVNGTRSLHGLLDQVRTHCIDRESLREFDPKLLSFLNLNTREEYESALKQSQL